MTGIDKLGLEPSDEHLTADYLKANLGGMKKPIKEMLHDQSVIAGIGNIFVRQILIKCADWIVCTYTNSFCASASEAMARPRTTSNSFGDRSSSLLFPASA